MADRPSITSDYVSVIARTIENAQNDPAQLRSLVYDIARSCLARHILMNYHELGDIKGYRHMLDLENAINQVESLSQRASEALTDGSSVQLLNQPANSPDHNALVVREPLSDATAVNEVNQDNRPVTLPPTPTEIYRVDEPFPEIIVYIISYGLT